MVSLILEALNLEALNPGGTDPGNIAFEALNRMALAGGWGAGKPYAAGSSMRKVVPWPSWLSLT
jgi:hypothetical protein